MPERIGNNTKPVGTPTTTPVRTGGIAPSGPVAPQAPVAPAAPGLVDGLAPPVSAGPTRNAVGGFGTLAPSGKSMDVPAELAGVIRSADEGLSLEVMNTKYNPLKAIVGAYTRPTETYEGKAIIPTRTIVGGVLQTLPADQQAALAPILGALPEATLLRTPAHQYNLGNGVIGNRVVFYGGSHGHDDLDKVAIAMGKEGIRLVKQMAHFPDDAPQGGTIEQIFSDGVGGTTHAGGYSVGFINGVPKAIFSDWPADYGKLNDSNETYNANLIAIDYNAGVEKDIPRETRVAYKNNADMWDAVLGAMVPFAGSDPNQNYTNYKYNPLDVWNQESLASFANDASSLDWEAFKAKHGAFYCAEGQYVVANLGPQESTQMKKSKFGDTQLGKLIDGFQSAPEYVGKDEEFKRTHPELGWKQLTKIHNDAVAAAVAGGMSQTDAEKANEHVGISDGAYKRLESTGRLATYMQWQPEEVPGWQEFKPLEKDGLVATPMTIATLAWSLMRRYIPREGIAATVAGDLMKAYAAGDAATKQGIAGLLGGNDPTTDAGKQALQVFAFKASTGFILAAFSSPEMKSRLMKQAGAEQVIAEDRPKLDEAYNVFLGALQTATNQKELDIALKAADDNFRALVLRREPAPGTQITGPMLYAAPAAMGVWAQQPFMAGTGENNVLRYLTTAMHANQENTANAGGGVTWPQ